MPGQPDCRDVEVLSGSDRFTCGSFVQTLARPARATNGPGLAHRPGVQIVGFVKIAAIGKEGLDRRPAFHPGGGMGESERPLY